MKSKSISPIKILFYISCTFFLRAQGQSEGDEPIELPGGENDLYPTDDTLPPIDSTTTITTIDTTPIPGTIPPATITEPPPVVGGNCPSQCLNSISDTNYRVDILQVQLRSVNNSLSYRMQSLETDFYTTLSNRINMIESTLNTKLGNIESKLTNRINDLETLVNNQLVTSTPSPDIISIEATVQDLQVQINTTRSDMQGIIDTHNGAIQSLQSFNQLWRKNFKLVNTTLATMKKNMNRIAQQG